MSESWSFPGINEVINEEISKNSKKGKNLIFENNKEIFDELKDEFVNSVEGKTSFNDSQSVPMENLVQENAHTIPQVNNLSHVKENSNEKIANENKDINETECPPKEEPNLDNLFESFKKANQNYIEKIGKFKKTVDNLIPQKVNDCLKKLHEITKNDIKKKNLKEKLLYLKLRQVLNLRVSYKGNKTNINFRCNNCEKTTFNGYRFTCSKCKNKYHLCEECILIIGPIHPSDHLFKCCLTSIIDPLEKIKPNSNYDSELVDISQSIFEFPYKKAEDRLSISIILKNTGKKNWDNTTLADFIDLSGIPISISNCKVGETKSFEIFIDKIKSLEVGNYLKQVSLKNSLGFFGTIIDIRIKITPN